MTGIIKSFEYLLYFNIGLKGFYSYDWDTILNNYLCILRDINYKKKHTYNYTVKWNKL